MYEGTNASKITALILNAPFFDFNDTKIKEFLLENIIVPIGKIAPKFVIKEGKKELYENNYYTDILSRYYFDQERKICHPSHIFAGWIKAISKYHRIIQSKNIQINIPILVLTSATTNKTCNGVQDGDCVLDVDEIKTYSKKLDLI